MGAGGFLSWQNDGHARVRTMGRSGGGVGAGGAGGNGVDRASAEEGRRRGPADAHADARAGDTGLLEGRRPARLRAEVRGGLAAASTRSSSRRRRAQRLGRLDEGAHPVGPAPHGPPRLRDGGPVPQGRSRGRPDLLSRTALELFYAQSLVNYAQTYSWEISQRERVESTGAVDLKAWTREQIYAEAARAYVALWKEREALGAREGRGPLRVRRAERLPDRDPRHAPRRGRLLLRRRCSRTRRAGARRSRTPSSPSTCRGCCAPTAKSTRLREARRPAAHPLDAARRGPRATSRPGTPAAASARRRSRRGSSACAGCSGAFTEDERPRPRSRSDLEARLPAMAALPWCAMGKAQLAELLEHGTPARPPRPRPRRRAEGPAAPYPSRSAGDAASRSSGGSRRPTYQLTR